MKTIGVLAILLVLFSICPMAGAKDLSGGLKPVVVIGVGEKTWGGPAGPAPELDFIRTPPSVDRDPSRYSSPGKINFTPPPVSPTNQSNLSANITTAVSFVSISTVNGTGDFSAWRSLDGSAGVKAKQISNGRKGSLDSDNRLLLSGLVGITSPQTNKSITVVSRDVVKFSGLGYRDSENYNNDWDRLRNSFEAVKISKESNYFGKLSYSHSPEDDIESDKYLLYNRSIIYNLGAEYTGASSFNSKIGSGNGSDISEEYRGTFALTRRISNNEILNQTKLNESCIPCHLYSVKSRIMINQKILGSKPEMLGPAKDSDILRI